MGLFKIMIFLSSVLSPVSLASCPLQGFWKSHEQLTLKSLAKAENITSKQFDLFEKDFFGKLFIKIDCDKFTAIMEDWVVETKYEVVSHSKEYLRMRYESEEEGNIEKVAMIEGNCYSVEINGGKFRESFCPISEEAYSLELKKSLALKANLENVE